MTDPRKALVEDLASLIDERDRAVIVHSGIWSFAGRLGVPRRDAPAVVLDALLEAAGPSRTILMPAYTYDFPRTGVFDLKRSRPETGLLAEYFMSRPGVTRVPHPSNSYSVYGPASAEVLACPTTSTWGPDSVMGWMYKTDARFISLGVHTALSCSYFHYAEEMVRVPYRYFKRNFGRLHDDGVDKGPISEVRYVRPLTTAFNFMAKPADDLLEARGLKRRPAGCSDVFMEGVSLRDIADVAAEILRHSPYAFIPEDVRPGVRRWVDEGGAEREIAEMAPERRVSAAEIAVEGG